LALRGGVRPGAIANPRARAVACFAIIKAAIASAPWHGVMDQVKASRSRQWPSGANRDATDARFPP